MVRVKLMIGRHTLSMVAMFYTEPSTALVDNSIEFTLHLQNQKASLTVVVIHRSQDVKN